MCEKYTYNWFMDSRLGDDAPAKVYYRHLRARCPHCDSIICRVAYDGITLGSPGVKPARLKDAAAIRKDTRGNSTVGQLMDPARLTFVCPNRRCQKPTSRQQRKLAAAFVAAVDSGSQDLRL